MLSIHKIPDENIPFNELDKIPFKFRDGSIHYYHPNSDKVYSYLNSNNPYWYISPYSNEIKFRYTDPDGYRKYEQNKQRIHNEKEIKLQKIKNKYLSYDKLIQKHKITFNNEHILNLSKDFVDDVITNFLYEIKIGCYYANSLEFYETYPSDRVSDDLIENLGKIYNYIHPNSIIHRNCDIMYDIEPVNGDYTSLKLKSDGYEYQLNKNTVLPICSLSFTQLSFNKQVNYKCLYLTDKFRHNVILNPIYLDINGNDILCMNGSMGHYSM